MCFTNIYLILRLFMFIVDYLSYGIFPLFIQFFHLFPCFTASRKRALCKLEKFFDNLYLILSQQSKHKTQIKTFSRRFISRILLLSLFLFFVSLISRFFPIFFLLNHSITLFFSRSLFFCTFHHCFLFQIKNQYLSQLLLLCLSSLKFL